MTAKSVLRTAAWTGGLAVVVYLTGVALKQAALAVDPNEAKAASLARLGGQNREVLYLGNSVAYQGINPQVIEESAGKSGFNLALGGSSPIEQELLLRSFLEKNARPKLIVFGVTPNLGEFGIKVRPTIYLDLEDSQKHAYRLYLESTGDRAPSWSDELFFRLAAYRHRTAIEPLLKFMYRGQSRTLSFVDGHMTYNEAGAVPERFPPRQAGIDTTGLRSLLDYCGREKLPVLLVELPNSPSFNAAVEGRPFALAAIEELIADRRWVRFVSFNDEQKYPFTREDWLGTNHFNTVGARKFSRLLAPRVAEMLGSHAAAPHHAPGSPN